MLVVSIRVGLLAAEFCISSQQLVPVSCRCFIIIIIIIRVALADWRWLECLLAGKEPLACLVLLRGRRRLARAIWGRLLRVPTLQGDRRAPIRELVGRAVGALEAELRGQQLPDARAHEAERRPPARLVARRGGRGGRGRSLLAVAWLTGLGRARLAAWWRRRRVAAAPALDQVEPEVGEEELVRLDEVLERGEQALEVDELARLDGAPIGRRARAGAALRAALVQLRERARVRLAQGGERQTVVALGYD